MGVGQIVFATGVLWRHKPRLSLGRCPYRLKPEATDLNHTFLNEVDFNNIHIPLNTTHYRAT